MDLFKEAVCMPGVWVSKNWWEQAVLYLVVARAEAAASEEERVGEDPCI